jgi:hypothetical protein
VTDEEHITSLKQAIETLSANGMVVQFFKSGHQPYYEEIRRTRASGHQCRAARRSHGQSNWYTCAGRSWSARHSAMRRLPIRNIASLTIAGRLRSLSLPRDSIRVQQFRELGGLTDAQRRKARGSRVLHGAAPTGPWRTPRDPSSRASLWGRRQSGKWAQEPKANRSSDSHCKQPASIRNFYHTSL